MKIDDKTYTVLPGKHDFTPRNLFPFHFGKTRQRFWVRFHENCLYTPTNWENDTNKGGGWSYGFGKNRSSLRWGWRRGKEGGILKNYLEVPLYTRVRGQLVISDKYFKFYTNRWHLLELRHENGKAYLYNIGNSFYLELPFPVKPGIGLVLDLYFGGDDPAPNQMDVDIDLI